MELSIGAESGGWCQGSKSAAAGLYDWQIDRIEQETSDSQLYKQAGNGVTVNVIEAIGTLLRQADTEIRAEDEKTKR